MSSGAGEFSRIGRCVNWSSHGGKKDRSLGPDLSAVGRRFGPPRSACFNHGSLARDRPKVSEYSSGDGDRRESCLAKSRWAATIAPTKLATAIDPQQPSKLIEIEKTDIEWERPSPVSWMPAGLLEYVWTPATIRESTGFPWSRMGEPVEQPVEAALPAARPLPMKTQFRVFLPRCGRVGEAVDQLAIFEVLSGWEEAPNRTPLCPLISKVSTLGTPVKLKKSRA